MSSEQKGRSGGRGKGRPRRVWDCPFCPAESARVEGTREFRVHLRVEHGVHQSVCINELGELRPQDEMMRRLRGYRARCRDYFIRLKASETIKAENLKEMKTGSEPNG